MMLKSTLGATALFALIATPAFAQDDGPKEPRRIRVTLGGQVVPKYPGAEDIRFIPYVDLDFTRGDTPFPFAAPDDSFGIALINRDGFSIGPALALQGSRRNKDVGRVLGKVDTTIEGGGFVQVMLSESFRLRAEGRKGFNGHEGFAGNIAADVIFRDGDKYVFSVGPRANLTDGKFQRAYFGVSSAQSVTSGLPVYRPRGGLQSVGATAGLSYQFNDRWGFKAYGAYDRLVDDAADSPVVRTLGSRDQFSGGVGLSYTFGG